MTATLSDIDQATIAELIPACQEHKVRLHRPECPEPAAWIATFTLSGVCRNAPPVTFLLCDAHTQEWAQHVASCPNCIELATLTVEPLDRKAERP